MKKTLLKTTALLGATVLLSACTNTPEECDPSVELNMFSKAACQFSGSYDKRIEQKEKLVLDAKKENAKFNKIYADIKAQQKSVTQSIAQKKAQQAKLNQSVDKLTAELKQKAKGRQDLQAEIAEVEKQMKAVNSSGGSEMEKQAELEQLQRKLSNLQKALGL